MLTNSPPRHAAGKDVRAGLRSRIERRADDRRVGGKLDRRNDDVRAVRAPRVRDVVLFAVGPAVIGRCGARRDGVHELVRMALREAVLSGAAGPHVAGRRIGRERDRVAPARAPASSCRCRRAPCAARSRASDRSRRRRCTTSRRRRTAPAADTATELVWCTSPSEFGATDPVRTDAICCGVPLLRAVRVRDAVDAVLRRDEHEAAAVRDALRRRVVDRRERRRRAGGAGALGVRHDRDVVPLVPTIKSPLGSAASSRARADVRDRADEKAARHVQARIGRRARAGRWRARRQPRSATASRASWSAAWWARLSATPIVPGPAVAARSVRRRRPLRRRRSAASAAASNAAPASERSSR